MMMGAITCVLLKEFLCVCGGTLFLRSWHRQPCQLLKCLKYHGIDNEKDGVEYILRNETMVCEETVVGHGPTAENDTR